MWAASFHKTHEGNCVRNEGLFSHITVQTKNHLVSTYIAMWCEGSTSKFCELAGSDFCCSDPRGCCGHCHHRPTSVCLLPASLVLCYLVKLSFVTSSPKQRRFLLQMSHIAASDQIWQQTITGVANPLVSNYTGLLCHCSIIQTELTWVILLTWLFSEKNLLAHPKQSWFFRRSHRGQDWMPKT